MREGESERGIARSLVTDDDDGDEDEDDDDRDASRSELVGILSKDGVVTRRGGFCAAYVSDSASAFLSVQLYANSW